MVSQLDAKVGEFIAALDETGQRNETLVVFTSDKGGVEPLKNAYVGATSRPIPSRSMTAPPSSPPWWSGLRPSPPRTPWAISGRCRRTSGTCRTDEPVPRLGSRSGSEVGGHGAGDGVEREFRHVQGRLSRGRGMWIIL